MNAEHRSGSRGLAFNLASAALPLFGAFAVSVFLAPYFGDAAWGEYSLVLSAATLLLIVAKFGLHAATSRLLTEHEDAPGPWLRAGLTLRLLFTLSTAALATLFAPALADSFGLVGRTGPFWLVGAVVVGASALEWATEALVGLRAFRAQMVTRLAALVFRLGAVGVVIGAQLGVVAFLVGHSLSQVIPATLVIALLLWRSRGDAADPTARRRTFDLAVPLAFSSASFLVYSHTDRLMLGWMHGTAEVGQFAVARNVLDAAMFPMAALAWSLRPAFVRAVAGRSETPLVDQLGEGLRLSVLYATLAIGGLAVLGPDLLAGLYRGAYPEAEILLLWLLPVMALRCVGTILFPALVALDRQDRYARWMAVTAVINVVANLVLIPHLASRGAILATCIALAVLTLGATSDLRRSTGSLGWGPIRGAVATSVAGGAVLAAIVWPLRGASLALQIGLLALAAFALAFVQIRRRPPRLGS